MTFLRRLLRALKQFAAQYSQQRAILAQRANDAQAAYDAACARGDTRAQHTTLKALQGATHALMRAEVGHG